tara:strand:+ start:342 stop:563 length:222 start_codon:yes stop_codon:yes gene_type:complete
METLDLISRIFMIASMIYMTIYWVIPSFSKSDEEDLMDKENDIYETTEVMDYDEAVQWYIMHRDSNDDEIRFE